MKALKLVLLSVLTAIMLPLVIACSDSGGGTVILP